MRKRKIVVYDLNRCLQMLEITLITHALRDNPGNKSKAAEYLGINRTTLVEKMKRYGFPINSPSGKKPVRQ